MVVAQLENQRGSPGGPLYLTRFVGRVTELEELRRLLLAVLAPVGPHPPGAGARLITLVGAGGFGKTRLAVEVTDRLLRPGAADATVAADEVLWADLASLHDATQLSRAVAVAAGLPTSPSPVVVTLRDALRDTRSLLVLDHCDQFTRGCEQLAEDLLAHCPGLVIIATSRTPVRLDGSTTYALDPLSCTVSSAGPVVHGRSEAVELCYDRAALVTPGDPQLSADAAAIDLLCRRLSGVPLAIELASPWIRVLSVGELLARIDQSLEVLASTSPHQTERHRSMRAVLNAAWRGLSDGERRVVCGLGAFVGGFTLAAAEAIAGATLTDLDTLAERSWIHRLPQPDGSTRYGMHELIAQHVVERLTELPEVERLRLHQRHLAHVVGLAERATAARGADGEAAGLRQLRIEEPNLELALTWALDQRKSEDALQICATLFRLWTCSAGPPDHRRDLVDQVLAVPWDDSSPTAIAARARTLHAAGFHADALGDFCGGVRYFTEAVALWQQVGDHDLQAACLRGLGYTVGCLGDHRAGERHVSQSLAICRREGDPSGLAWSYLSLAEQAFALGKLAETKRLLLEVVARFDRLNNAFGAYCAYVFLGNAHLVDHEWSEAVEAFAHSLALRSSSHFTVHGGQILLGLAEVAVAVRQPERAAVLYGASHGPAWGRERHDLPSTIDSGDNKTARQRLGDNWKPWFDAGRRLTSDQVLTAALQAASELAELSVAPFPAALTDREVGVIRLVAQGHGNGAIAEQLSLSKRTVDAHLRSIYSKLSVASRTAAVHEATRSGLLGKSRTRA